MRRTPFLKHKFFNTPFTLNGGSLPVFNYRVMNATGTSKVADVYVDGYIITADSKEWEDMWMDGEGVSTSFKSFRDSILKSDATTFNVYINSGGGVVTEAMAIHDLLKQLQKDGKTVNTIGRGLVASAATYILMAGNSSMTENSWFMIHNVASGGWGDVNEIENLAKQLRSINNSIRDFYATATGLSATEVENLMNAETWLSAQDAFDKKFVKAITVAATISNAISTDKLGFKNTQGVAAYNSAITTPPTNPSSPINSMKKKFLALLNKVFDGKPPANVDVEKLAGDLEKEAGEVPTENSIKEMVKNAVAEALAGNKEKDATEETEDATDSADEDADDATETEDSDDQEEEEEEAEKPAPAKATNKPKAKPAENGVSKEDFEALQKKFLNLQKQIANRAGGKSRPPGNSSNSDEQEDPTDHDGVGWV
jgi:ATP-dependent protease ClpP protease subunit